MRSDPGPVAQGRALTRLAQENRERYRQIYVDGPPEMGNGRRRSWALTQLSLECPERYRELYLDEKGSLISSRDGASINPEVVGQSSGPGPLHAVLADGSATVCGRVRFDTFRRCADRQVTCTYCFDELRKKQGKTVDPKFREDAGTAEVRLRELAELRKQTASAEAAVLEALSLLRTPPNGTAERAVFAGLIDEALKCGLTLKGVGERMNLTGERIRQLAAEAAE